VAGDEGRDRLAAIARVEDEATIDLPNCDVDILAEVSESECSKCEDVRVIRAKSQCLSSKIDTDVPDPLQVFALVHH
jgi:hypothetical protein